MEFAEQAERNAMQTSLFDMGTAAEEHAPQYIPVKPWGEKEQLMQEKTALGFFFSGHPYNTCKKELSRFIRRPLNKPGAGQGIDLAGWCGRRRAHPDDTARQDVVCAT
jgi:DNA polymerase-3 subunit alpha